ncbi:MAG: phosphatidate cytidylyltransferase [Bacilli bacterium]|nr:phosphatidate cytidylyltransferase [Bacilli bacterium]
MKIRVISAAILLAILIPIIIIGRIPFALVIGIIGMMAVKEINDLYKYPNVVKLLAFLSLIGIIYSNFDSSSMMFGLNYNCLSIILLGMLIPIIFYQAKNKYTTEDAFKLLGFILLIGLGLNCFILVREHSLNYFMFMILIPIITDTFAYIGGVMIGTHKVTKLSPKKSWEGYIIGSLMGTFIITMYYTTFINIQTNLLVVILAIFIMTIIGQIGDLFFSAIKRQHNIKDFSNLIPGHGGVMDRLDSLIFVSLIFVVLMKYL